MDAQGLKEHLLQTDNEFRRLAAQHQDLEQRLSHLTSKTYLSQIEQVEETTLKKQKLRIKDRMEDILRRYRAATPAAEPAPSPSPRT